MAMGKRNRERQPTMWVQTTELPTAASHPFYLRLTQMLRGPLLRRFRRSAVRRLLHPHDPDANITKMKDGRTHLAHKGETTPLGIIGGDAGEFPLPRVPRRHRSVSSNVSG